MPEREESLCMWGRLVVVTHHCSMKEGGSVDYFLQRCKSLRSLALVAVLDLEISPLEIRNS